MNDGAAFTAELREDIAALIFKNNEPLPVFTPGTTPVPVSGKVTGNPERACMVEAALDGKLTGGRFNELFEASLARFLGVEHVVTVNSGSSANLVALSALSAREWGKRAVQPGDEVITTAAGFPTTIAPILQVGATPVFVDVDPSTWNTTAQHIRAAVSGRTGAVILAHTLGMPFDAEEIAAVCREYDLRLIEDCCDALGARSNGRLAGTFGHAGTLSFYPAHHITTGEGGAVFTDDAELARLARAFRDWGRHCRCAPAQDNACGRRFSGRYGDLPEGYDHKYVYMYAGYNMKMTDMAAACGVAQMERLPGFIRARRENYARLRDVLQHCRFLRLPELPDNAEPSWFGFPVLLADDAPLSRLELLKELDARKIGVRLLFAGNAVRQPFMQGRTYRVSGNLAGTDMLTERAFWLGVWPGLTPEMLRYVAESLVCLLDGKSRSIPKTCRA
ncbi:MAG: lipopolysaccharide biosynthesis protein RfbH [Desulfovibrio sp.]|nr:lipopolysaccharide biosynthesis protein RfbH [Desulfovibrio sp.]